MRGLVIALHDVAPATLAETARWRSTVAELTDGPVSLLVVPRYHGVGSWRSGHAPAWTRTQAAAGDEVVLHGYTHLSRNGRDGREMAGRGRLAVAATIRDGLEEMRAAGLDAGGFIAPSYAHPHGAAATYRSVGLQWWATRTRLFSAGGSRSLPSVGLGASTPGRRILSPPAARMATALLAGAPVLRLDLHPADLHHARLERAGRELLARLLDHGRRPMTHGALSA